MTRWVVLFDSDAATAAVANWKIVTMVVATMGWGLWRTRFGVPVAHGNDVQVWVSAGAHLISVRDPFDVGWLKGLAKWMGTICTATAGDEWGRE